MKLQFVAGLRGVFGTPTKHNTLEILQDQDGNYLLVIQESCGDMGDMRSGSIRIESPSGDILQRETYKYIAGLAAHIHEMHTKHPDHPAYRVTEDPSA
ncbi:MAG: hypothetical protein WC444_01475 [Candidatus Paceibacterota bacterium]